jgi:CDP-2,3-bis-(O-geranylgeranyl)-sn-glycerol synthase
MVFIIIQALYFFLPSYVSNAVPVLMAKFHLFENLNIRVDLGKSYKGEPLFGKTKTYRGIIGGSIGGILIVMLQSWLYQFDIFFNISLVEYKLPVILILGLLLGLGEGLGDLLKSFIKRRLHIKSSDSFMPFDQLSFLGSLFLCFFYVIPPLEIILAILILSPLIPIIANIIAYKLKLKNVWW